jgi:transposase InsO family protein
LFKDDFSRFRYIYCIKQKSDVTSAIKRFLAEVEAAGHVGKQFSCDNGGEFKNKEVSNILHEKGIRQVFTMPYTPQQNGSSERNNRTIV